MIRTFAAVALAVLMLTGFGSGGIGAAGGRVHVAALPGVRFLRRPVERVRP